VASLGDLDGDGVVDLAVGGQLADGGKGVVWVLFLNTDGTVKAHQKISETEGGFTGSFWPDERFGHSVAYLGDLDGDGVGDLSVGGTGDDDGFDGAGAVWLLFLHADGTVKAHQKISLWYGSFTGALDEGDAFGGSVAFLGDLDGDGYGDLAVGARDDDDGGQDTGAVWVLFLDGPTTCLWDLDGPGGGPRDGVVAVNDFFEMLATWGCVGCPGDFLPPPGVDIWDLDWLLSNWGPCPEAAGAVPPSLPEEFEDAGLVWPDDWDIFVDCVTTGTLEQQDNCVCWLSYYLDPWAPQGWPDCPGDDPFASPLGPQIIDPGQQGQTFSTGPQWARE
jgi:hypothetical protein